MVRFEADKLVIELKAYTTQDALDKWMELHSAICDVMRNVDEERICETFYRLPDFLEELKPEWDVARKMIL